MESEINNLQKRVAELEAVLATISKQDRRSRFSRRASLTILICAVLGAIGLAFTFTARASSTLIPQGPSKVTAPFQVVDSKGHGLFAVAADPSTGGGDVLVWNKEGRPAVEISATEAGNGALDIMGNNAKPKIKMGIAPDGEAGLINLYGQGKGARMVLGYPAPDQPNIQILQGENLKLSIGTGKYGDGLMVLKSGNSKANLTLEGSGIFQANNKNGATVVSLGVNGFGGGDLHLRNSSGKDVVAIFSEQGQTGIAQLFDAAGTVRLTLGTLKETGQGDVCAYGDKGSVCLRFIRPGY